MRKLAVEYRSPSSLKPRASNPRTHSPKQIRQLGESIKAFGFTNPILIDDAGGVVAGHGRLEAAKRLGLTEVPTIRLSAMSEAEIRAYVIADNKLALNAGWDTELLALELQGLLELDFDIGLTGFDMPEIDVLVGELAASDADDQADAVPEVRDGPAVSRPGDLWRLGRHRLLCGDARRAEAFSTLMAGKKAQMVFTDAPYNVAIDGNVCGLGKVKHAEFAMASGEMSPAEFTAFLNTVFKHLVRHSADGSIHFLCMDWRHMRELLDAAEPVYSKLKNLCVWNKDNGGMGTFYRSQHELVFVWKNGTAAHINNFQLGQHGRYRTNVWDYPGVNTLREGRQEELAMHPTVKPVALVADAILDCSNRGGLVLDAFCGSGTTLIAAEKTGRKAAALEIAPKYVDTAVRRWQAFTGEAAVHAETDATFAETEDQRASAEAAHV